MIFINLILTFKPKPAAADFVERAAMREYKTDRIIPQRQMSKLFVLLSRLCCAKFRIYL